MLCSKSLGKASEKLAHEVALMTRRLCTTYVDPASISALLSCKLIALDKAPGAQQLKVRPIGVDEVLRRIVGRAVTQHLKGDIISAAGPLEDWQQEPASPTTTASGTLGRGFRSALSRHWWSAGVVFGVHGVNVSRKTRTLIYCIPIKI